ncbi:2-oxoglutarate-dependent dioxygenase [Cupriavidus pauculus]|uniref:2-oxoglutarate-dependent dioxygenase n=1 Tax=Cupriavidus pauculus TaxID=82633 RepID=A0A5P2HCM0_9BURK|nr:2OG-Fe(II) oxygenase [Cupriavidus pauculus]QET05921.1 2-oxoglutarate-dependent dioxygenase [Cupriavidus pauculus]
MTTQQTTIHFSDALGDWIARSLGAGHTPGDIVDALAAQQFDAGIAGQLVAAIARAQRDGLPMPRGALNVAMPVAAGPVAAGDGPRIGKGPVIATTDRDVRVVSRMEKPLIAVLEGVLSGDECEALVAMARPRLTPSTTVDPSTGFDMVSGNRTSEGMFFRLEENPLVARIDRRISALMGMPVENGEGLQVLRYAEGARSAPHFDFLMPSNAANQASIARSGQRVSTLVIYLNDVAGGGDTVFPEVGFGVVPRRGNAVYFEYCDARNQLDARTLHAGSQVTAGEKWVVTKWMRQRRFVPAGMAGGM